MNLAILSRNPRLYSTNSLYRAAYRRGHRVEVIDHTFCNVFMEKSLPQLFYRGKRLGNFDAIIPRIGASVTPFGATVIRQFEAMNVFTILRSNALLESRDKLKCLQKLSKEGIDVPRSFHTYQALDIPALLDLLPSGPVVIKLLESTHGSGVVLAETRKSAVSIIEAFTKSGNPVMVQEFIEEAAGTDIRAFVVGGEVVAAMKRHAVEGDFRSNLHRGGSAIPVTLNDEEKSMVQRAARIMGTEVAGIDLIPSRRGNLVIEVNPSPGLEGIETITGVNIAGKIIEYLERRVKNWKLNTQKRSELLRR